MLVLLVEDHRLLAETLIDYLATESIEVDYAANGLAGLELAKSQPFDATLRLHVGQRCSSALFGGQDGGSQGLGSIDRAGGVGANGLPAACSLSLSARHSSHTQASSSALSSCLWRDSAEGCRT